MILWPLTQSKDFLLLYAMGKGGRRTQATKVAEERKAKLAGPMEVGLQDLRACAAARVHVCQETVLTEGWKFMQISLSCHNFLIHENYADFIELNCHFYGENYLELLGYDIQSCEHK